MLNDARIPLPTVNLARGTSKASTQPIILSEAQLSRSRALVCTDAQHGKRGWQCSGRISQPGSQDHRSRMSFDRGGF